MKMILLYLYPILLLLGGALFGWLARWYRYGGRCGPGGIAEGIPNIDTEGGTVRLDGSEPVVAMDTGRMGAAVADDARATLGSLKTGYSDGKRTGTTAPTGEAEGSTAAKIGAIAGGTAAAIGAGVASAATAVKDTASSAADATKSSLATARESYAEGRAPGETPDAPEDRSVVAKMGAAVGGAVTSMRETTARAVESTKSAAAPLTDGTAKAKISEVAGNAADAVKDTASGAVDATKSSFGAVKDGFAEGKAPGETPDAPADGSVSAKVGAAIGGATAAVSDTAAKAVESTKSAAAPLTDGTAKAKISEVAGNAADAVKDTASGAADATKSSFGAVKDGFAEGKAPGETPDAPADGSASAKVGAAVGGAAAALGVAGASASANTGANADAGASTSAPDRSGPGMAGATLGQEDGHALLDAGTVTDRDADGNTGAVETEVDIPDTFSAAEIEAQNLIASDEVIEKPAGTLAAPRPGQAQDDLKRIKGIGPKIEGTLNSEGIYHFDQIAGFGARDIAWADRTLAVKGRVVRDRWVPQAQGLAALEAVEAEVDIPETLSAEEAEAQRLIASGDSVDKPATALDAPWQGRAPDDLQRIRGIGPKIEGTLNAEGIYYFDQLAELDGPGIAWADRRLAIKGRVVRDRWVAQARALAELDAREAEVDIPETLSAEEAEAQRLIASGETVAKPANTLTAPRQDRKPDDLKRIKGIGPKIEATLNAEGIYYFDQIAELDARGIAWADTRLAVKGRVVRDRWVPQSQGLAALGPVEAEGDSAAMRARFAALSDEAEDDASSGSGMQAGMIDIPDTLGEAETEAQRLIESGEEVGKPANTLPAPETGRAPDDLKLISGIGPKIQQTLNGEGVYYFDQIADFGGRDLAWADRTLGFRGRVVRDRWIPQAKGLAAQRDRTGFGATVAAQGGEGASTDAAADTSAEAAAGTTPLRLAEAEALRLIERDGGYAATAQNRPDILMQDGPVSGRPDDLQRIKGIGDKLERVLNGLGIYYFRQIASFSATDIAWIDSKLKFKGRVIRDRWVPQADTFEKNRD